MINWTIYKITNPRGRIYIGMTSNFDNRIKLYAYGIFKDQKVLGASIKKYGFENHIIEKIEEFRSEKKYAIDREVFNIAFYQSNLSKFPDKNGMNLTDGGEGTAGLKHSKEAKLRRSAAMIKKMADPKEKERIAKIWSDPNKRKQMSDLMKARYQDPNERAKTGISVSIAKSMPHRKLQTSITTTKRWANGEMSKSLYSLLECNARKRKIVEQYDKDGNFIKEHESLTVAASAINGYPSLIRHVLSGKRKTTCGFVFKYKNDPSVLLTEQKQT